MTHRELPKGMLRPRGLLLCLMLVTGLSDAGVYKWVDEQGQVHYGERPPAQSGAQEIKLPPAPTPKEVEQSQEGLQQLLQQQRRAEGIQRRAEERHTRRAQQEAATRERRCTFARQNLRFLEQQRPVYWVGDDGKRVYLDDKARAELTARLKEEAEAYCD
jgi:Domain of unknown function (DUF4124)